MEAVLGVWGSWTAGGLALEWWHRRCLQRVPHRFLVHGFRGKTTLVRLLHGALEDAGVRALGRTTGDAPEVLLPGGAVQEQRRLGPPNIRELRRVMRRAAALGCQAAAVENMAVQPDLVRLAGTMVVRPTVNVWAWDAPDHLEHYPADRAARAALVARLLNQPAPVVLPADERNEALVAALRKAGVPVHAAEAIPGHKARRARAMAGVVAGIFAAAGLEDSPDPEIIAARAAQMMGGLRFAWRGATVVDLLSANDPESTAVLMQEAQEALGCGANKTMVYFHRADRPQRFLSFAPLLEGQRWLAAGDPLPRRYGRGAQARLQGLEDFQPGPGETVFLVGNHKGGGQRALDALLAGAEVLEC